MSDEAHRMTDAKIREIEKRLKREYTQAAKDIEKKLNEYWAAFERKDKAKKQDVLDGKLKPEEYQRWRTGQLAMGERWRDMQNQISSSLVNTHYQAISIINGYLPDVYSLNHNWATYQIERDGLLDTDYTLYDKQTVERLIREDPDLLPPPGPKVKKDIAEGKLIKWEQGQIQSVAIQSIIQGESIPQMAKRIAETVSTRNYNDAVRYARTASTSAQNAGRYDGYRRAKNLGVDLKIEWQATLDNRTRHDHRMLHGQRRDVDEPFIVPDAGIEILYPAQAGPGASDIPQREIWNCRCTLLAWVKGYEGQKITSSPKTGDLTFDEWQKARTMTKEEQDEWIKAGKPSLKAWLKPKTLTNNELRKKTLEKAKENVKIVNTPLPKSLKNFQAYEQNWRETHYREYTDSQKEFVRQKLQEVFDNGEYHMAIRPDSLEKVMQSGRFKNQLETGTSGGVKTEEGRKRICMNLFGADVDSMQPRDFEKYGYLGHRDFAKDAKEATALSPDKNGGYGSVIVRFNKQALNNRVTYTANDSYGGSLAGTQIAGHDGSNVSISGIETFERTQRDMLNTLMFASDEQLHNPNSIAHAAGGSYIELQYHGEILIKDVASVCFTDSAPTQVVNELKNIGIPVYRLEGMKVIEL